ncbi:MAG: TVP38/TMEM64 family protein, partial [Saprospiraceae bacterium]|nr:TVP38/TMEM64 family protein [Pyrinomonadaceae bacterium]
MKISGTVKKIRDWITELGKLTPIALVTTFMPILGAVALLFFGAAFGNWLRQNWEIGFAVYFSTVLVLCGLALMATNVIGIIGGWAFGMYLGLAVLMAGIVGAAAVSFLIHRRIVGDKLPEIAEKHPKAQAIYEALVGKGFWRAALIILLVRLSVIMPFALTNFLLASAKVAWPSYLAGTFLGMLPRSGAVVFAGAG